MAKKVVLIVLGAFLLLVGLGATGAGAAILIAFGSNDTIQTGPHQVTSQTHALISQPEAIQSESSFATNFGTPTVRIRLTTSQPGGVFAGIAPTSDVDGYLGGVAVDQVTQINLAPYSLDTQRRNGQVTPARPTQQSFWVAKATGTSEANLVWPVTSGNYRVVLMRADASSGINADATFGLTIPHIRSIALGLLIGGVVVLAVGILLLVLGIRAKPPPRGPISPVTQAWPATPSE